MLWHWLLTFLPFRSRLFLISCEDQSCKPNIQEKVNIDDLVGIRMIKSHWQSFFKNCNASRKTKNWGPCWKQWRTVLYKPNQAQFFCWFRIQASGLICTWIHFLCILVIIGGFGKAWFYRLLLEYKISVFTSSFCAFQLSKCTNTNTCILHWQR